MFDSLSSKLQNAFRNLRGLGKISETNIADTLREVRLALLEADVNFKVARDFIERVKTKAIGVEVVQSVQPGQQIIKIIHDELVDLLGSTNAGLDLSGNPTSILMVVFANDQRLEGMDERAAALAAGNTRIRPVLMTASAMIIGMLPMALGLGEGGEQNAPLGRAVIGGLMLATVTTLFAVPIVYSLLRKKPPVDYDMKIEDEEREDVTVYLSEAPPLH